MRKSGTPPQIIYAYKRTGGLLLTEDMREHWPPDRVKEWDNASDEYFAIEEASKGKNVKPLQSQWTTKSAVVMHRHNKFWRWRCPLFIKQLVDFEKAESRFSRSIVDRVETIEHNPQRDNPKGTNDDGANHRPVGNKELQRANSARLNVSDNARPPIPFRLRWG